MHRMEGVGYPIQTKKKHELGISKNGNSNKKMTKLMSAFST